MNMIKKRFSYNVVILVLGIALLGAMASGAKAAVSP